MTEYERLKALTIEHARSFSPLRTKEVLQRFGYTKIAGNETPIPVETMTEISNIMRQELGEKP